MADGTTAASLRADVGAGRGLLFPVQPTPGETLLSYVVRCVERNLLQSPVQFLRQANIDLSISGDLLVRLQHSLDDLQDLLGEPAEELKSLWGADSLDTEGRRRLGGVFLRSRLIDQARRRVSPSLAKGEGDQAIWMVRHFDFCPLSWDLLVTACPNRFCRKLLTWPRADSLRECRHCREPLVLGRPEKVPKPYRPVLAWLAALFHHSDEVRRAAMCRVPAGLKLQCETDAYEFVLAIVHAKQLLSSTPIADGEVLGGYKLLHAAASFVLDYPKSCWDIRQDWPAGQRDKLYGVFAKLTRDSPVPVVRSVLSDIIADAPLLLLKSDRSPPPGELTSRGAASVLGVPPGDIGRLVEAGYLTPLSSSGRLRKQHLFDYRCVEDLRSELTAGLSIRRVARLLGLPQHAVEQLVAYDVLRPQPSKVSVFLRGDARVRLDDAEGFHEWLEKQPVVSPSRQWVPLTQAFAAVGGRDKPWAPVIRAAISGELPGGLVYIGTELLRGPLCVSRLIARQFISGGPEAITPLRHKADGTVYGLSPHMSPGEVMDFLNCSAVEISWLRDHDLLLPEKWVSPTTYDRASVEAFGQEWMTTREAAARLEVEPRGFWRVVESYPVEPGLGRGFYRRSDLEEVVRTLAATSHRHVRQLSLVSPDRWGTP